MSISNQNLSINSIDQLLDKAVSIGLSPKTNINRLMERFSREITENALKTSVEIASNKDERQKFQSILKKWRILCPDSFMRMFEVINLIINNSLTLKNENNIELLRLLDTFDANLNKRNVDGLTPLTYVIRNGKLELAKLLVELGADLNKTDNNGWTPLMCAILGGKPEFVKLLVQLGADVNKADDRGWTPLTYVIRSEQRGFFKLLVEELRADLNKSNGKGWTPLIYAIMAGKTEFVKLLVDLGADLNKIDDRGWTPLTYAIAEKKFQLATQLVELGADLNKPNGNGWTPLAFAIGDGNLELLNRLVELGADKSFAENLLFIKFLGQVWGLTNTTKLSNEKGVIIKFKVEGNRSKYVLQMLNDYTADFFKHFKLPFSDLAKQEILEAIGNCYFDGSLRPIGDILSTLERGKPFVISGGTSGHAISMVIYNDKLFVCNRGEGGRKYSTTFYRLPPRPVLEKLITQLSTRYESMYAFNSMLDGLNLTPLGGFVQKDQKSGNCAWASSKAALGVLFHEYAEKKGTQKESEGRLIYKAFTKFARKKVLESYLISSIPKEDPTLLNDILKKARKKGLYSNKLLTLYGSMIALK